MATIKELKDKATSLSEQYKAGSVTPKMVGGLFEDLIEYIETLESDTDGDAGDAPGLPGEAGGVGYKPTTTSIYSETCDNVKTALNEISDSILGISAKEPYHVAVTKQNDELSYSTIYKAVLRFQPVIPAGSPVSIRVIDDKNYTSQKLDYIIVDSDGTSHSWNQASVDIPFGEGITFDYAISTINIQTYYQNSITVEVEYESERYLLPMKVEELETNLGDINSLSTDNKSSVVGAINNVNGLLEKVHKSIVLFDNVPAISIGTPVTKDCYLPAGGSFKLSITNLDHSPAYVRVYLGNEEGKWIAYQKIPDTQSGELEFTTSERVTYVQFYGYSYHALTCEVDYYMLKLEATLEETKARLGDINSLSTDDKSSVVGAVNSVNGLLSKNQKSGVIFENVAGTAFSTAKEIPTPVIPSGGHFVFTCTGLDGSTVYAQIYLANESEKWLVYSKTPNGETGSLDVTTAKRVTKVLFYAYNFHKLSCEVNYSILTLEDNLTELNNRLGDINSLTTEDKSSVVGAVNSIVRTLPEMNDVTVYDVVNGSGNGVGNPQNYDCSIKKGSQVIISQAGTGTYTYYIVTAKNITTGESQKLLEVTGGTLSVGGWDILIELTIDVEQISIMSYPKTYVNITHTQRTLAVETEVKSKVSNRWYGKKWLLIGDSISTERESFVVDGYGTYVAKSLGLVKTNVAVSGKTMSWAYTLIDSYNEHYDLITVMLGTNNQGYNTTIGELNDSSYTAGNYSSGTFTAMTQLLYEKIRAKWPKSVVAFITPIKRANEEGSGGGSNEPGGDSLTNVGGYNTNALGLTTEPYAEAVKKVCQWYSIPCIDIFNTIDPRTQENRIRYFFGTGSADGTHPNSLGHALFIAPVVEAELVRCAPYFDVVDSWEFPDDENNSDE